MLAFKIMTSVGAPAPFSSCKGFQGLLFINTLSVPLLVVHGAEDDLVRLETSKALVERVLVGQLEVLRHCGHVAVEEQPEALVGVLSRFI